MSVNLSKRVKIILAGIAVMIVGILVGMDIQQGWHRCICARCFTSARQADVVVYGGTPGGISAAVSAAREGAEVILIEPGRWIGGMITGGLSVTDAGVEDSIGGLALEFKTRLGTKYGEDLVWEFEPSVATTVFREMLEEAGVTVVTEHPLYSIQQEQGLIKYIRVGDGVRFNGKVFIDATYEGDLMAAAGVEYRVGRESREEYDEYYAGVVPLEKNSRQFSIDVPAYNEKGELAWGCSEMPPGPDGSGDSKVQAYNFRLVLTKDAENMVPISPPPGYDPRRYELLGRYKRGRHVLLRDIMLFHRIQNGKIVLNDNGAFSFDYIGGSWDYPEADFKRRAEIVEDHVNYTKGLLWYLCSSTNMSHHIRHNMSKLGYCRDEFTDNGYFPTQLYIREARRMVGQYVMREQDVKRQRFKEDSIGMGSNFIESHHVQRYIDENGMVKNEGFIFPKKDGRRPYDIPFRSVLPKPEQCSNLMVPVCLSATHIAYSSIRMEPVYMILGQSCGVAAAMAVTEGVTPGKVDVPRLQTRLRELGQITGKDQPELLEMKVL